MFFEHIYCTYMKEVIRNKVAELRLKANITQEEMGEKVGVSRQTIIAIEKGNYTPSVLLALKIADFFNKKVEDIFFVFYEK